MRPMRAGCPSRRVKLGGSIRLLPPVPVANSHGGTCANDVNSVRIRANTLRWTVRPCANTREHARTPREYCANTTRIPREHRERGANRRERGANDARMTRVDCATLPEGCSSFMSCSSCILISWVSAQSELAIATPEPCIAKLMPKMKDLKKNVGDLFCSPQAPLQIRSPSFSYRNLIFTVIFVIQDLGVSEKACKALSHLL